MKAKNHLIKLLYLPVLCLVLGSVGCVHRANTRKLDQLGPNEALAVGRLTILYKDAPVTKGNNLLVRQRDSSKTYQHVFNATGLYVAHLPVGEYKFFNLVSNAGFFSAERQYAFKPDEVTFKLSEPGKAYYIGDITVDWTPPKGFPVDKVVAGGAIGLLLFPTIGGDAVFTIYDRLPETRDAFRASLNTGMDLIPAHAKVKSSQPPSEKK